MIPRLGIQSELLDIAINDALEPVFPKAFLDEENAANLRRALAPPPKASANEIVAPTGGSYYWREAPHLPPLVSEGDHFEAGQPLFIIEVMKMFNKVLAPFAGTLRKNLMLDSDGAVVRAGQMIFEIEPDEVDRRGVPRGPRRATQTCDARGPLGLSARRLPPSCSMEPFISGHFRSKFAAPCQA